MAVDENKALALAARNLAFDGLAGSSLGGCLATLVAARPLFRGAELSLFGAGGDLALLAPEQRAQIVEMRDYLHRFVRGILQQGIDEGHFDPSIDVSIDDR